jgi:hypothetical protein
MRPISFIKSHPVATVTLMATGMVVGPWILGMVNRVSGVGVSLPSVGGNSG